MIQLGSISRDRVALSPQGARGDHRTAHQPGGAPVCADPVRRRAPGACGRRAGVGLRGIGAAQEHHDRWLSPSFSAASPCWSSSGCRAAAHDGRLTTTSTGQAFGIGLYQVLALVPGVSRSGATIVGGMLVGLDRPTAAEFSFFLAMPTLAAAFAHSLLELAASDHRRSDRWTGRSGSSWRSSRPRSSSGHFSPSSADAVLRRSPGTAYWWALCCCWVSRQAGFADAAVAAPQLHCRLLRHRSAVHHRRRVHLDLRDRRRADRVRSISACSDGRCRDSAS